MSIVEKKLSSFDNDNSIVEKLDADELTDFYKILTMCELLLSKYESRKFTYQNMRQNSFIKFMKLSLFMMIYVHIYHQGP